MSHLDEGIIVSLRDREWAPERASIHAESCAECESALLEARHRSDEIGRALDALDALAPDVEEARTRIRARIDARAARELRAGARWWSGHLGRAAAVLLVATGAVSALPGSPVRGWLSAPEEVGHTVQEAAPAAAQEAGTSGVAVTVPIGGIRVLIHSLGPIDRLEVVWSDQATARVDAPAGSRFTYGEGRVEAMVAGGRVRVELPRSGEAVSLEVDGRPYLARRGDDIEVTGPVGAQSDEGILFTTP